LAAFYLTNNTYKHMPKTNVIDIIHTTNEASAVYAETRRAMPGPKAKFNRNRLKYHQDQLTTLNSMEVSSEALPAYELERACFAAMSCLNQPGRNVDYLEHLLVRVMATVGLLHNADPTTLFNVSRNNTVSDEVVRMRQKIQNQANKETELFARILELEAENDRLRNTPVDAKIVIDADTLVQSLAPKIRFLYEQLDEAINLDAEHSDPTFLLGVMHLVREELLSEVLPALKFPEPVAT